MNALEIRSSNAVTPQEFNAKLLNDFTAFLDVAPKTVATYQRALRQMFKFFTDNGVKMPTYEDVLNFKKSLEAKGRKASTIALYLASARRFFTWTEQRGIFPNVAAGVKAPRSDRGHKRDYFGAEQLKSILRGINRDTLKGRRNFAIVALMAVGGLRTIEVARANFEDLQTLGGEPVLYVQGKGRKDKADFVKIPAQVLKAIQEYISARGKIEDDAPLFAGIGNRNKNGRLTTRCISGIAKSAMRSAGYDNRRLSAHSLRHSAVTIALLSGARIDEVRAFARHSNIATTTIYAHNVDRLRSQCENNICSMIF